VHKNGATGNPHILVLTDKSLHNLKLDGFYKNTIGHKKYNLLEIATVQNGYISKVEASKPLDINEVNPGNYAIRLYVGSEYYKTFKCPDQAEPDDMHKRQYAQRKHIIHCLDSFCYQLHILSFFYAPLVWVMICRLIVQSQISQPRHPAFPRSLMLHFGSILLFNTSAIYFHATQGAVQGRAVMLDFIGLAFEPSATRLLLLDTFIIVMQMLLATIAYETSLARERARNENSASNPTSPSTASTHDEYNNNNNKTPPEEEDPYVLDLPFATVITRLRHHDIPPPRRRVDGLLPLPSTAANRWPLPAGLGALMRARVEMTRQRVASFGNEIVRDEMGMNGEGRIPGTIEEGDDG